VSHHNAAARIAAHNSIVEPTSGQTGLNRLTFGNVGPSVQPRHVGHLLVALVLMGWTLYLLWREYNHFVEIRQNWLTSSQHQTLARTRTVAIANLPDSVNSESAIKELGGVVSRLTGPSGPRPSNVTDGTVVANGSNSPGLENESGGIRQVWLAKKTKEVEKVWEDRDKEVMRLEAGSSKLSKLAAKNQKKGKTPEKEGEYFILMDNGRNSRQARSTPRARTRSLTDTSCPRSDLLGSKASSASSARR